LEVRITLLLWVKEALLLTLPLRKRGIEGDFLGLKEIQIPPPRRLGYSLLEKGRESGGKIPLSFENLPFSKGETC